MCRFHLRLRCSSYMRIICRCIIAVNIQNGFSSEFNRDKPFIYKGLHSMTRSRIAAVSDSIRPELALLRTEIWHYKPFAQRSANLWLVVGSQGSLVRRFFRVQLPKSFLHGR